MLFVVFEVWLLFWIILFHDLQIFIENLVMFENIKYGKKNSCIEY